MVLSPVTPTDALLSRNVIILDFKNIKLLDFVERLREGQAFWCLLDHPQWLCLLIGKNNSIASKEKHR